MASKKKSSGSEKRQTPSTADYYKMKSKAVDDLVSANEENTPVYTREELEQYSSAHKKIRFPEWLKAILIKTWFAGAVCFFILWGLGTVITSQLDMLFVLGVVLGMVTDLLTNNIFRFFEKSPGQNDKWMLFPKKRFASFFFNIIYAFGLLFCVYNLYNLINMAIIDITNAEGTIPLGVEPILFGVFYMAFDMLFIGAKQIFISIFEDAKKDAKK